MTRCAERHTSRDDLPGRSYPGNISHIGRAGLDDVRLIRREHAFVHEGALHTGNCIGVQAIGTRNSSKLLEGIVLVISVAKSTSSFAEFGRAHFFQFPLQYGVDGFIEQKVRHAGIQLDVELGAGHHGRAACDILNTLE